MTTFTNGAYKTDAGARHIIVEDAGTCKLPQAFEMYIYTHIKEKRPENLRIPNIYMQAKAIISTTSKFPNIRASNC